MEVLGIDVSGRSFNANIVEITTGTIVAERFSLETPRAAKREDIVNTLKRIMEHYDWSGPIGVGFPGVVRAHTVISAANLDKSLVGLNIEDTLLELDAFEASAINEADAAGIAEMKFGAGIKKRGSVLMVTIGTGVGTALFYDKVLVPNIELGHAEFQGIEAETILSERARVEKSMTWESWAQGFNKYLNYLAKLLSIDTIVIGGEVTKDSDQFEKYLSLPCEYKFAKFGDESGIIGAALAVDY